MTEKLIFLIFSVTIIVLYSMNFNSKWMDRTFEKVKKNKGTWFWFRIFKVEQSKENYVRFIKGISVFVIATMTITLVMMFMRG